MDSSHSLATDQCFDVCVVGLGYVGLTLAAALASRGQRVLGYESNHRVVRVLQSGTPHLLEPGIEQVLTPRGARALCVTDQLPDRLPPAVVICVGTPLRAGTGEPELAHLDDAVGAIAARLSSDTLVVLRSTVPVGTCRQRVLPALRRRVREPLLAFCPERTIQGKALEELGQLPQIVGALDERARARAAALFAALTPIIVPVSSLEAAEAIKLICNCHTDLLYAFGNEVALIAEALGLDAHELVSAANLEYPRPDLARPGFVGGSCLTKDPYLLLGSVQPRGYTPGLVVAAREFNETLPRRVGERVLQALADRGYDLAGARVLLTGFAYKGEPETDDVRGAPIAPLLDVLRDRVGELVGHDFVVSAAQIAAHGVEPVELEDGFTDAHAVLVLNNHPRYRAQNLASLVERMHSPAIIYDTWGVFADQLPCGERAVYLRLGNG